MKTIKFRGRDIETGKFVYGNLLSTVFGTYIYDARGITFNPCDCCMVENESVAQLVGLDVDGKEIYEGDTVTTCGTAMAAALFPVPNDPKRKLVTS